MEDANSAVEGVGTEGCDAPLIAARLRARLAMMLGSWSQATPIDHPEIQAPYDAAAGLADCFASYVTLPVVQTAPFPLRAPGNKRDT
jgi:hypothetical protein